MYTDANNQMPHLISHIVLIEFLGRNIICVLQQQQQQVASIVQCHVLSRNRNVITYFFVLDPICRNPIGGAIGGHAAAYSQFPFKQILLNLHLKYSGTNIPFRAKGNIDITSTSSRSDNFLSLIVSAATDC